MTALDTMGSDLGAFFDKFDDFVAAVFVALEKTAGSSDPAIIALDATIRTEMGKLSDAADKLATFSEPPAAPPDVPATPPADGTSTG